MSRLRKRENGSGSVYRRSDAVNRPWVACTPSKLNMRTGEREREIIGRFETRKDALDALEEFKAHPTSRIGATFKEIYEEWSEIKYKTVSKSTMNCYKAAYLKFSRLYNMRFKEIRTADLQEIFDYYTDEHFERGRDGNVKLCPPLSKASLEMMRALLSLLYKYAMQNDIVYKDYSRFTVITAPESDEKQAFSDIEVKKIEKAAEEGIFGADYVLIMCYTGYRINEFLSLTRFNYSGEKKAFMGGGNKTQAGKNKIVPVHPKIEGYVRKYLDMNGETVFCDPNGKKWDAGTFKRRAYYPALKQAGVRELSPHATRRTFATRLAAAGARPEDMIKIMGHSNYQIDISNYIKQESDSLTKAINLMK